MSMRTMDAVLGPRTRLVGWCVAMAALGASGCDAKHDDEPLDPSAPELAQIEGVSQIVTVPDPNGSYFAEVLANGTGCPPGTWNTRVSADGLAFTTTFSNYVTEVNPAVALNVRDCQIAIKLHTPNGRSFSVQEFSYSGYALLQPGVTGRQSASYYFEGDPVPPMESNRKDLIGPYDNAYVFSDAIPVRARTWSKCGTQRDLKVTTRVQLNNGERRAGYMNLSAVDGSGKLVVKLDSTSCDPNGTTSPNPPPGVLGKPNEVSVQPGVIEPGQSFSVQWQPFDDRPWATYQVQLRRGNTVLWDGPEIGGRAISYNGPALQAGTYQVYVIVRDGTNQAVSDPVTLTVGRQTPPPPPPPVTSIPAWAQPLVGRYAMRIESYTTTALGLTTANEAISLAEFVVENGQLEFRERSCSQTAQAFGVNLALRHPEAYPLVRRKVLLDDAQRWSTDNLPIPVGYQREGVAQCAGRIGADVPKLPFQTWIRGSTCRCRDVESAPLIDDCRVTDPDKDGFPGISYKWGGTASDSWVSHTAVIARTHFLRGRVDPGGGHSAAVRIDETSYQYVCEPSSRCGVSFASWPCTPDYNSVRFVRLPNPPSGQGEWTCPSVMANRSRFFPRTSSPVPTFCARETPTDQ